MKPATDTLNNGINQWMHTIAAFVCKGGGGGASVCVCGGYMHIDSAHYPCLYLPNGVSEHLLAVMSYFAHVYTLFFSDKAGGGGGHCIRVVHEERGGGRKFGGGFEKQVLQWELSLH